MLQLKTEVIKAYSCWDISHRFIFAYSPSGNFRAVKFSHRQIFTNNDKFRPLKLINLIFVLYPCSNHIFIRIDEMLKSGRDKYLQL